MIIKKADLVESSEVVELIKLAIGDMTLAYTGYDEEAKVDEVLKGLYAHACSRFSCNNVHVAYSQNKLVGQITAYPANFIPDLNLAFEEFYNPNRADKEEKLRALLDSREGFEGEYYIDSLAVFESFRGLGIAHRLIEEVELIAGSAGFEKMSLLVDLNNEKAEKLYEKMSFKTDKHVNILGHPYKHMVKFIF